MARFCSGVSDMECNIARTNVSVWRSSANYVRMDCGVKKFSGKAVVVKQLQNRYVCYFGVESFWFLMNI